MPLILPGNVGSATATTGYNVANSLRFNSGSSDDLVRTAGSSGQTSRTKGTLSVWLKRSRIDEEDFIFYGFEGSANRMKITFLDNNKLQINSIQAGSNHLVYETTRLFRDVSAWYHIVIAIDTTLATAGDRCRLYINGVEETSFATESHFSQNDLHFLTENNIPVYIGSQASGNYFDGYMAEYVLIDGLQLDQTSFGEFDSDSPNIWKPIDVSGLTFGTHGFYLDFENASSLGADVSGNSNNFTVNNLTSVDQSTDTCTNNFCTLNSLIPSGLTYSEGNLGSARTDSGNRAGYGTFGVTAGKWYWEFKSVAAGTASAVGIGKETNMGNANQGNSQYVGSETNDIGYYTDGNINESASSIDSETSWTDGDIISVAMDLDNNKVYFAKNGTYVNSGDPSAGSNGYSITNSSDTFFPQISHSGATDASALLNFGTSPFSISSGNSDANGHGNFEYAVPSGYFALCTKNLAEHG